MAGTMKSFRQALEVWLQGYRLTNILSSKDQIGVRRGAKGTVLSDYGWTKTGQIGCSYRLSVAAIRNGFLSIPASLKRHVSNEYRLYTEDGVPMGSLLAAGNQFTGLSSVFRRRGGEPGDYALLTLDVHSNRAEIAIGDASIVEQGIEAK